MKSKPKKCHYCRSVFTPFNTLQKYCSPRCANKAHEEKRKSYRETTAHKRSAEGLSGKQIRKCAACLKPFEVYASQIRLRGGKFCSVGCAQSRHSEKASVAQLDALWAKVVKQRANNRCEYCGKEGGLNAHHIFSRSNMSTRWLLENGVSLCVSHHVFGNFSAHKSPIEFAEWLKETRGEKWYDELRLTAKTPQKVDRSTALLALKQETQTL